MNFVNGFIDCVEKFGDKPFLITKEREYTYEEFSKYVNHFNAYLKEKNIPKDTVIGIVTSNSPTYLAFTYAALGSGYTINSVNANLTPYEIVQRAKFVNSSVVFAQPGILNGNQVSELSNEGFRIEYFNSSETLNTKPLSKADVTLTSDALLQFTGGTSGTFKAAIITHENIINHIPQLIDCFGKYTTIGEERVLVLVPFYHSFSLIFNGIAFAHFGASLVLVENVRDMGDVIYCSDTFKPTITMTVNTMYRRLMQHPDFNGAAFSSFKICMAGGEKCQPDTKVEWEKATGKPLYEAYGLTETTAMLCSNPIEPDKNVMDSVGLPLPNTQIELMDKNNNILPRDSKDSGEIVAKGPQVTKGYLNNGEANQEAFTDGWFRTGDVGEWKEGGYLKILDRSKDMISVSGMKVYPSEVEAVLLERPDVIDCGVIGLPDDNTGERVVACILSEREIDKEVLRAYCREKLTQYKVPKDFIKVQSIPKSSIGKTSRPTLKKSITI